MPFSTIIFLEGGDLNSNQCRSEKQPRSLSLYVTAVFILSQDVLSGAEIIDRAISTLITTSFDFPIQVEMGNWGH